MADFKESLPEEMRNEKSLESFKGDWETAGPEIAKSFISAQKMIGSRIPIPTKETRDAFIKDHLPKLYEAGVLESPPSRPEDYGVSRPDRFDEEMFKGFMEHAHKSKLPKSAVDAVVKWYDGTLSNFESERERNHDAAVENLKKEFGSSYDEKIAIAQRAVGKYATEGLKVKLDTYGLGDDPDLVKFWVEYAMLKNEDAVVKGTASQGGGSDAKDKIAKINNDPKHPYWDEKHPDHKKAVEEMQRLFKQIV